MSKKCKENVENAKIWSPQTHVSVTSILPWSYPRTNSLKKSIGRRSKMVWRPSYELNVFITIKILLTAKKVHIYQPYFISLDCEGTNYLMIRLEKEVSNQTETIKVALETGETMGTHSKVVL